MKDTLFNPVKVINSFLGIPEGTILKFDAASGKYVTMAAEEDIGEGEYYYSGFAMAIDPCIVRDNMTDDKEGLFEFLPIAEKKKKKKPLKVVEEEKSEIEKAPVESGKPITTEEKKEVESTPEGNLSFMCGLCRTENFIHKIKHGLFFPVSAGTSLHLKCSNCGIESVIYYVIEDESDKESK